MKNAHVPGDGTRLSHAVLPPDERGHLPATRKRPYGQYDDHEFFQLPGGYCAGHCPVYNQAQPTSRSRFHRPRRQKVNVPAGGPERAVPIVREALRLRADIYGLYRQTLGQAAPADLMSVRDAVSQLARTMPADNPARNNLDRLTIKCVLLDYLLT